MNTNDTLIIETLGSQGDGIATVAGEARHIPFTLPGEEVRPGPPLDIINPSDARIEPICQHFGTCGGCALQHMEGAAYRAWKRQKVVDALAHRGLECDVSETFASAPGERRRATFSARRTEAGLLFGYHMRGSKMLLNVSQCPILVPDIEKALPRLRKLAALACPAKGEARLSVFSVQNGLDVSLSLPGNLGDAKRTKLIEAAMQLGFTRLSLEDEILIESEPPLVEFGGVQVSVAPGGFAQASITAEDHMVGLVTEHLKGCKQVADLFCGAGTFSLPLARQSKVLAYEFDAPALRALDRATRKAKGLKTLKQERRDLFRRPLQPRDMKYVDGLVFDPPRAGAEAQCQQIAKSNVRKIVGVSCNPATFARDARILVDGGFTLHTVAPVDQFLYSPHIELVAFLSR